MAEKEPKTFPTREAFEELRRRVRALEEAMAEREVLEFARPPKAEVRRRVLKEVEGLGKDHALYPSDVAWKHRIDPELVEECMEDLVREGKLVTGDSGP